MNGVSTSARVFAILDAWNARDLDLFISHFAEDAYWHDLGMPHPPAIRHAAIRSFAESALRAFPDFTYTIRGGYVPRGYVPRVYVPLRTNKHPLSFMTAPKRFEAIGKPCVKTQCMRYRTDPT